MTIRVDVSDAIRVLDSIAVEKRGRRAMTETLAYYQTEVRLGMPVDQGIARGSVQTTMSGSAAGLSGTVASSQAHVVVIEEGRRPGATPPPVGPIRAWLERHGKDGRLAFVVARAIGRRGLKAQHVFKRAAERGLPRVDRIWMRHFRM